MNAIATHMRILALLSGCMLGAALAAQTEIVSFRDTGLEEAIRDELGKYTGDITVDDMNSLSTLHAEERNINELRGLEYATNLTALYLGYFQGYPPQPCYSCEENWISDISPITNLTQLVDLRLEGNEISDLSPLTDLVSLRRLDLSDNCISDITPLAKLESLQWLDLSNNQIDISPGSPALQIIDDLLSQGVEVYYKPQREPQFWGPFTLLCDGWVETDSVLGKVFPVGQGWIYSLSLDRYFYLDQSWIGDSGAWFYVPRDQYNGWIILQHLFDYGPGVLFDSDSELGWIFICGGDWFYSLELGKFFYLDRSLLNLSRAWVYVPF